MGFPKKEILMAYISRSCDLDKNRITQKGNLMAYVSRLCNWPGKEILMVYISNHHICPGIELPKKEI
jgi:hypothetical protein